MDTQTQIDRLIELAIIQRTELKQLVEQLPQLREHLNSEVEKVFDETEPQLRAELEEWTTKQTADKTAALGVALEAKIAELAKSLEVSTQARYNAIIAEREENARLAAEAEAKIAEHAASLPGAVKEIVSAELARFPRAGEIDQLRKEFAEPRGLNPRGKWQAGESYNKLDFVTINGDSYASNIDNNRTRPSRSSADWTLVAARGTGGGGGPTSLSELTTVPSDGDVLIGSGTSWVTSNLTAGAGISITVGPGAITISATDGDITLDDGTAASPSLHFTNDPDTGIYRPAANTLGISVSGTQVAYFDENGLTVPSAGVVAGGSFHGANGNANNPSLSFSGDQNTGFFRHQPDEIGISLGGTQTGTLTAALATLTSKLLVSSGATTTAATDLLVNPAVKASGNLLDLQVASSSKFSVSSAGNGTFAGNLTVSGAINAVGQSVVVSPSSGTAKGRINSDPSRADVFQVGSNWTGGAQDDATKPSWYWFFDSRVAGDSATLFRVPAGGVSTSALAISSTAATLTGNLTVSGTGTNTFSGPIRINASASAPTAGSFSTSAGNGLEIWPKSGSNYDLLVYTAAGSSLLSVPSGTNNLTLSGNLTVSGTGNSSFAGKLTIGTSPLADRMFYVSGNTGTSGASQFSAVINPTLPNTVTTSAYGLYLATNIASGATVTNAYSLYVAAPTYAGSTVTNKWGLYIDDTNKNYVSGNFLLGTTTDSGNGKLQLATHATSAGGIGFGTDTSFFRSAAGNLAVYGTGTDSRINFSHSTSTAGKGFDVQLDTAKDAYVWQRENRSLFFGTNNTTALTLDSSQNATFAGTIIAGNGTVAGSATNQAVSYSGGTANNGGNFIVYGSTHVSDPNTGRIRVGTTTVASWDSNDFAIGSAKGLKLGNAYQAGAPTATGYVIIKDSTGTSYKIPAVAV